MQNSGCVSLNMHCRTGTGQYGESSVKKLAGAGAKPASMFWSMKLKKTSCGEKARLLRLEDRLRMRASSLHSPMKRSSMRFYSTPLQLRLNTRTT